VAVPLGASCLLSAAPASSTASPEAAVQPHAFQATAAAVGSEIAVDLPGAPLTDTPLDSGGPSGEASLDSLGEGTGFASFPDPGQFLLSLPGLVAGLLGTGASGLPPIHLPPLPSYPFEVTADSTTPTASTGEGSYALEATDAPTRVSGSASAGLQLDVGLSTARLTSDSSITVGPDGTVVATATSEIQGLTVGPVAIGQITTTATETMDATGIVTPTTSITIDGARVGSVPVEISTKGVNAAGTTVQLPLSSIIDRTLKSQGITFSVATAQLHEGRVIAPSIEIDGPVPSKRIGTAEGSYTVTLGGATAALQSSLGTGTVNPAPPSTGSAAGSGATAPGGSGGLPPVTGSSSLPPAGGTAPDVAGATTAPTVAPAALIGLFDIRSLYLVVFAAALAAFGMGQLTRWIGVRVPWTSTDG
jgi:hypothetical protein